MVTIGSDLRDSPTSDPEPGTERGRPHAPERRRPDPRREREILGATLRLLSTVGYDRMSMDAVAAGARAGKATLYRRWSSKPDLVVDAMRYLVDIEVTPPDTGDLRADLLAVLGGLRRLFDGDLGGAACGVLGELRHNPDLRAALRRAFADYPDGALRGVLHRAVERGDLPAGVDIDLVAEIGLAVLTMRLVVAGESVSDQDLVRLVDHVLLPALRPAAHAPPDR